MIWIRLLLLGGPLVAGGARAQTITYHRSVNETLELREINADGSGDHLLTLAFPAPLHPVWNADGTKALVVGKDPQRPSKLSLDLFQVDAVAGRYDKEAAFEDKVTAEGGKVDSTVFSPFWGAYSPNGKQVAVCTSSTTRSTQGGNSGTTVLASLWVFPLDNTRAPIVAALGTVQSLTEGITGRGGSGVAWVSEERLLYPLLIPVPLVRNGIASGTDSATAIISLVPQEANVGAPQARQVSHPRSVINEDFFALTTTLYIEHDSSPAVAPDGTIAYLRAAATTLISPQSILPQLQPIQSSIRLVNLDGSNDRELVALAPGEWVNKLAWAPDSSSLAFDVMSQSRGGAGLVFDGNPATSEIHLVSRAGAGRRRLVGSGATTPSWRPQGGLPPALPPRPQFQFLRDQNQLELSWPVAGGNWVMESVPNLAQPWTRVAQPPVVEGNVHRLRIPAGAGPMFFRLNQP